MFERFASALAVVIALGGIAVQAQKSAPDPQPTVVYDPYCEGLWYYLNGFCWFE